MRAASALLLLLSLGCSPDPSAAALRSPPPDVSLSLSAGALIPGAPFTLIVDGGVPGERIQLARSPSGLGAGPCLPAAGFACLDLAAPVLRMGSAVADIDGQARWTLGIPAVPMGLEMGFQALALRGPGGADSALSNPIVRETVASVTPVGALPDGTIVITELMTQATAPGGDWIELHNGAAETVDLSGLEVVLGDGTTFVVDRSVIVAPGAYAVLGGALDAAVNGGVWFDHVALGLDLDPVADSVRLEVGGVALDEVVWAPPSPWPGEGGASMSLSSDAADVASNDEGWRWCPATAAYGAGDLGTPGAPNPLCTNLPPNLPPIASALCTPPDDHASAFVVDTTGSSDGDGVIVDVQVDFGDGDTASDAGPAAFTHTFNAQGTYDVTVTVTDDRGGVDVATCQLTPPPALGEVSLRPGVAYTGLVSRRSFNFPAGPPAAEDATLTWDWLSVTCGGLASTSSIGFFYAGADREVGEDSTTRSCVWERGFSTVSASVIASARDAAGVIRGSAIADPSCAPGIGCAFHSDPRLEDIELRYAAIRPSARLACPDQVVAGTNVLVDASASTAGFGALTRWDFVVDGAAAGTGLTPQLNQTFLTLGAHTASVTVTDAYGLEMTDTCTFNVVP